MVVDIEYKVSNTGTPIIMCSYPPYSNLTQTRTKSLFIRLFAIFPNPESSYIF